MRRNGLAEEFLPAFDAVVGEGDGAEGGVREEEFEGRGLLVATGVEEEGGGRGLWGWRVGEG